MDANIIGQIIAQYVNATYPGGSAAFTKEGGLISLCLDDVVGSKALIYHPNLPKSFEIAIEVFNAKSPTIKIVVIKEYNFMGCDDVKDVNARISPVIESLNQEYQITIIANTYDPLILAVYIPNMIDEDIIDPICERIKNIPGLLRGYVLANGRSHPIFCDVQSKIMKIEPERCVISEDRILDLKITLEEDLDVLDFINKM